MSAVALFKAWYQRRKERAVYRAELEPWWTRWAVTLALIAIIVFAILDNQDGAIISSCVFFGLMALHFLLILLRKMNFSLCRVDRRNDQRLVALDAGNVGNSVGGDLVGSGGDCVDSIRRRKRVGLRASRTVR